MCALILNSPVIAALVAAAFGVGAVWLGLRRFRSERWWEKKAAAYSAIIEALHTIEDVETERVIAIERSVDLPIERVDRMRVLSVSARTEIRKFASQGGLVITDEAAQVLSDLTQVLEQSPSEKLYDYYDKRADAAAKAILSVKLYAKADLRI